MIILGIIGILCTFALGAMIGLAVGFGEGYLQGLTDKKDETN